MSFLPERFMTDSDLDKFDSLNKKCINISRQVFRIRGKEGYQENRGAESPVEASY